MGEPPAPLTDQQRALEEYGWCREAIAKYDDHLFRIRSWNMTLTIGIIGGYLGLSKEGVPLSAATMVLIAALSGSGFWLLDAMNKSLQMVYIYSSRDLERFLRAGSKIPLISPSIALRFNKKQGSHLRPAIKNLTDESIWPFYVLPMVLAGILGILRSAAMAECHVVRAPYCAPAEDIHVALFGIAFPVVLILLSRAWSSNVPGLRYLFAFHRRGRLAAITELHRRIKGRSDVTTTPKRYWPYKADFWGADFVVFIDSKSRVRDHAYLSERTRCLNASGLAVFQMDERRVHNRFDSSKSHYSPAIGQTLSVQHREIAETFRMFNPDENWPDNSALHDKTQRAG